MYVYVYVYVFVYLICLLASFMPSSIVLLIAFVAFRCARHRDHSRHRHRHLAFGEDEGSTPSPRLTEKTDFAWVPASSLLGAMRESRHKSTKRVVVKLGGCRFLRLFHKVRSVRHDGVST